MTPKKAIIFDASTLISLAMNGLTSELAELKKTFKGKFIITKEVKYEVIDRPINIKRFELEALRVKQLLDKGVFEMPSVFGIKDSEISKITQELVQIANSTFYNNASDIHLIDLGEASCMAVSKILNEKKIENVLAIDERTVRMLIEKPENLLNLLEKKLHTKLNSRKQNYETFSGFNILRSSELVYMIYKKGIIKLEDGKTLDALLYAVKFSGCSISEDEIYEIEKL
ncbi:MAG: hypothetical protein AABX88_02025 [Nanoarchaeota archaeon]